MGISRASNFVSLKWIKLFAERQSHSRYRFAYRLTNSHINSTNYQQMRVGLARDVFSSNVYAGMISMIEEKLLPVYSLTTAFVVGSVNDWYSILSNRQKFGAFYFDDEHIEKTKNSFATLNKFLHLIINSSFF